MFRAYLILIMLELPHLEALASNLISLITYRARNSENKKMTVF